MKRGIQHIFLLCFYLLCMTGCALGGQAAADGPNTVHMDDTSFVKLAITIKKGESLTLVNDSYTAPHPLKNGTWKDGAAKPLTETGAPAIDVTVAAHETKSLGPFNTAGTFNIYCTIHQGMYLTITVK